MTWRQATLAELCGEGGGSIQTGPFGSQLHAADYVMEGVPCVMPQDIGDNRILTDRIARIRERDAERLSRHRLRTGDIVYSRRGDVERRALVRESEEGWLCGTGCLRVRLGHRGADPRFISYRLGAEDARSWIRQHAVGATMLNLNTSILGAVPLTLPPTAEQEAIAEVLGALDDKIAANGAVAAAAESLAGLWFGARTKELPCVPLTELASPLLGGTPARADATLWHGAVPWVSAKDVSAAPQHVVLDTQEHISESASASSRRLSAHPRGTVVLTARGTVGEVARLAAPAAINQSCYAFRPGRLPPSSLYFSVLAAVDRMRGMAHGSVFSTVNMGTLAAVAVPDVRYVSALGPVEDLLQAVEEAVRENQMLASLRDTLLPQLMSGKLRVRDAERHVEEAL